MKRSRATALTAAAIAGVASLGGSSARERRPRLVGDTVQTPERARSARHHHPLSAGERAVAWATARRGMHEVGTTNCSPAISRWERHMGLAVPSAPPCRPWCGAFVHEAFFQAGIKLSARIMDPNQSYWDAMKGHNGLRRIPKTSVRPGDIVFFALDPGVQASHEALVVRRPRDGRVRTAEGNVGHHAVVTRRGLRYVVLAARVTRAGNGRPPASRPRTR